MVKIFETLVTLDSKVENFKKTEHSHTNHKWTLHVMKACRIFPPLHDSLCI